MATLQDTKSGLAAKPAMKSHPRTVSGLDELANAAAVVSILVKDSGEQKENTPPTKITPKRKLQGPGEQTTSKKAKDCKPATPPARRRVPDSEILRACSALARKVRALGTDAEAAIELAKVVRGMGPYYRQAGSSPSGQ